MRYNLKGTICADEDAPIYRWFGLAAVSPSDIRQALADNPAGEEFVLEINSGGGSVYAGFEMYSLLRGATVPTRAEVQSLAGSAASVVLAGADVAAASPVGQVMIHLPSTWTEGNQIVHRESVQMLEAVTGSIIAAYETKVKGKTSRDALRRMMDRETFLTAQEALDAGADIIMLDNMTPEMMKKAVEMAAGRAETECSGNVTKENIKNITEIGVDYVSSGALTHSAPILDVSLKNLHAL